MTNILLIDDNRNFRLGLAANLRKKGYTVTISSNGNEGIEIAKQLLPEVILSDIRMPTLDGFEVKFALNSDSITAKIPFIFISALSESDIKCRGLQIGAEDYITKPIEISELDARIQSILRKKEKIEFKSRQQVLDLLKSLQTSLPIHTSHLFRSNIGILLLSLEMIKRRPSDFESYIQLASSVAFRLKNLVNDLIYLNEIDLGKTTTFCEPIDLEISFLLPIHETFDIWKSKDLKTEIQIEPGILIKSVEYLFSQTVIRILDNACKFSPKGGLIKIKLESNGFTGCKLTIEDQGPGIPGQLRELVFQRFYQIQQGEELAQNHGMGLGLYLARSFAREWGGDVRILDSSSGCTVRMELGSPR